jgi:hypothetical protein
MRTQVPRYDLSGTVKVVDLGKGSTQLSNDSASFQASLGAGDGKDGIHVGKLVKLTGHRHRDCRGDHPLCHGDGIVHSFTARPERLRSDGHCDRRRQRPLGLGQLARVLLLGVSRLGRQCRDRPPRRRLLQLVTAWRTSHS